MSAGLVIDQGRSGIATIGTVKSCKEDARLAALPGGGREVTTVGVHDRARLGWVVDDIDPLVCWIKLIGGGAHLRSHGVHTEEGVARQAVRGKVAALPGKCSNIRFALFFRA